MLNEILKLKGVQQLNKAQKKNTVGGGFGPSQGPSCGYGDQICCGTEQWQCGTGPSAGGHHEGYFNGNPLCFCY